jgi:hypothetical protein
VVGPGSNITIGAYGIVNTIQSSLSFPLGEGQDLRLLGIILRIAVLTE